MKINTDDDFKKIKSDILLLKNSVDFLTDIINKKDTLVYEDDVPEYRKTKNAPSKWTEMMFYKKGFNDAINAVVSLLVNLKKK